MTESRSQRRQQNARDKQRTGRVVTALAVLIGATAVAIALWPHSAAQKPSVATTDVSETTPSTSTAIAPLSGLISSDGLALKRPALTIKIENTPMARPQYGVDRADVVYEEIVEGGITRLAAVFNTFSPQKVGPVRSVRRTDQAIVWPLGGLFAFSGGAPYAVASIKTAPVQIYSETRAGGAMFRDPHRYAPHNLYANAARMFNYKGTPTPPHAIFTYRAPSDTTGGTKVHKVYVGFRGGYATSFYWNAAKQSWDRVIFAKPDITGTGVQVSPKNVIVMWITYQGGVGAFGAEGILVGTGRAEVFTNGHMIKGTWSRSSKKTPIVYKDASGAVIKMTPGQTWVELCATGDPVTTKP